MKTKKRHFGSYLILVVFGLYMIFPFASTFFFYPNLDEDDKHDYTSGFYVQMVC